MNYQSQESLPRQGAQALTQPPPACRRYSYNPPPLISGILAGIVFVLGFMIALTGAVIAQTQWHGGSDHGAFIAWIDYRNDSGTPPRDCDVFVQYIQSATASRTPPPTNWVANGWCVLTNQQADQINPELDSDNIFVLDMLGQMTQGVVVTYQDDRYNGAFSGQPLWTVFANRIDANGVQRYTMGTPPWTADAAVGPSNEHQEFPRIVTTGDQPNVTNQSAVSV